jgi:hypothetical protein
MATATKKISDTSKPSDLAEKKISTKKSASKTADVSTKKTVAKAPAVKKSAPATSVVAEKKPAKAPATKKIATKKTAHLISPEHRYHMIATAAYYLAERRGFAGGYEMQDWISAEAEIDAQLKS